jgi:hypothetical protein
MFYGVLSAAQQPPGWQTYSNPDYGFTISYPTDIKLYNSARGESPESPSLYISICSETSVTCLGYSGTDYQGTYLKGAGVAINVLRDAKTEKDCHGIRHNISYAAGHGSSHSTVGNSELKFYQNVCFEIAPLIATGGPDDFDPGSVKEFKPERLRQLLDQVVHTFQFTGAVKDGADWKVSSDGYCGGSFEYPAGDTVRIVAQHWNDPDNAQRIRCSRVFTHEGRTYTLAAKPTSAAGDELKSWLQSSGYPTLDNAEVVGTSPHTDYAAPPYYYVYEQRKWAYGWRMLFIFSASGPDGRPVAPGDDPIYRHWLASFRVQ